MIENEIASHRLQSLSEYLTRISLARSSSRGYSRTTGRLPVSSHCLARARPMFRLPLLIFFATIFESDPRSSGICSDQARLVNLLVYFDMLIPTWNPFKASIVRTTKSEYETMKTCILSRPPAYLLVGLMVGFTTTGNAMDQIPDKAAVIHNMGQKEFSPYAGTRLPDPGPVGGLPPAYLGVG